VSERRYRLAAFYLYFHPSSCFLFAKEEREERTERREEPLSFFDFYEPSGPSFSALFCFASLFQLSWFLSRTQKVPRFFCGERAQKRKKKADKVWRHLPESVISYHKHKHTTHKIIMSFTLSCSTVRVNATVARSSLKVRHRNIARVVFFIRVSARS